MTGRRRKLLVHSPSRLRAYTPSPFRLLHPQQSPTADYAPSLRSPWRAASGPAAARNCAIDEAVGCWIAVLDSDDRLRPERLSTLLPFGVNHDADVVFDNMLLVNEDSPEHSGKIFLTGYNFAQQQVWDLARFIRGNLGEHGQPALGYLKPLIRRQFLVGHGIRYDESLRNSEDYHLILDCLAHGANVHYHPTANYIYSARAGSISHRAQPEQLTALVSAEKRFLERYETLLTPEIVQLVKKRIALITDLRTTERSLGQLKNGRIAAAARELLLRPQSLPTLVRHLLEAVHKRAKWKRV